MNAQILSGHAQTQFDNSLWCYYNMFVCYVRLLSEEEFKYRYGVEEVHFGDKMANVLAEKKPSVLLTLVRVLL